MALKGDFCSRAYRRALVAAIAALAVLTVFAVGEASAARERHRVLYDAYERGDALVEEQNFAAAQDILMSVADAYPDEYIVQMKLSLCMINNGDYRAAAERIERASDVNPLLLTEPGVRDVLAYCYEEIGEIEAAEALRAFEGPAATYGSATDAVMYSGGES